MDNSTPEVDASRPFRSVKEAISIFGDRLFLKQIPSPPKPPTIEVGNETPQSSPKLPTIEVGNETRSSPDQLLPTIEAGNETQSSPELLPTIEVGTETPQSSPELLPTIEAGNETQSSPELLPTIEVGTETPESFPELLPTIEAGNETQSSPELLPTIEVGNETQSSPKLPTIEAGNETQSSPELLPTIEAGNETGNETQLSPELLPTIEVGNETQSSPDQLLPTIEVGNETQSSPELLPTIEVGNKTPHIFDFMPSSGKPRNPLGEQDVKPSFDEPLCSSEIIPVPTTESPMNKMTPIPKNHKKENSGNIVHGNDLVMMMMVLKKLEVELQETKAELKLLKEKGTETELALASLNAELHKSMSKIAKTETDDEAGKARTKSITAYDEGENKETETRNEERTIRSELMVKSIDSPTLAQILSISDYEGYFKENKSKTKKLMKKKPIVPLVTDLCLWKKKESPNNHVVSEPIFSKMYFT